MNIYHIYRVDDDKERWYALALYSDEQAKLLGEANPGTVRVETWSGDIVWSLPEKKKKPAKTVH